MSRCRGTFKLSRPVESTVAAGRNARLQPPSIHLSFVNPIRAWGPALTWATVLFVLSAIPDLGGPAWLPVSDKVAHFGLFAVLGGTLAWGRRRSGAAVAHGWLIAVGLLYGVSDELHQMYVPGRMPDPLDWLADAFGVVVGYGTTWVILGRTKAGLDPTRRRHDPEPKGDGS